MANQVLVPPELDKRDQPREPKLLAEIIDEPAWKTIAANIYDLLYPRKLPPLVLTSKPIAVVDPMKENRGRAASIISVATHVVIIALLLWGFVTVKKAVTKKNQLLTNIDVPQYMPIAPQGTADGWRRWRRLARHFAGAEGAFAQVRRSADCAADGD
jgi:protein TonB